MNRPWRQIRQRLQIVCDQNTHRCSAARESSATDAQPANKNASPSARRGDAQRSSSATRPTSARDGNLDAMAGFAAAPLLDHVVLIHKNLSPTGGTKMVASKSESSCPHLSASSAARTFQSRLHRKPDARNLSLFKAVCKIPMMRSGLTTQAQRPGPRDARIATVMRWPGSLQRMVRRSSAPVTPELLRSRTLRRAAHRRRFWAACDQNQAARTGDSLPLSCDARTETLRCHGAV